MSRNLNSFSVEYNSAVSLIFLQKNQANFYQSHFQLVVHGVECGQADTGTTCDTKCGFGRVEWAISSTLTAEQVLRNVLSRTKDSDSDHGLGPWSVRLIADDGLGPRTRSDLLPRTRSAQKNRRLKKLPLMSDSVRGPRRLIGDCDVGLGPWSESEFESVVYQTAPKSRKL
ncbi:hypothetical protein LXL04_035242 [Taraxacum kok-saghyz]